MKSNKSIYFFVILATFSGAMPLDAEEGEERVLNYRYNEPATLGKKHEVRGLKLRRVTGEHIGYEFGGADYYEVQNEKKPLVMVAVSKGDKAQDQGMYDDCEYKLIDKKSDKVIKTGHLRRGEESEFDCKSPFDKGDGTILVPVKLKDVVYRSNFENLPSKKFSADHIYCLKEQLAEVKKSKLIETVVKKEPMSIHLHDFSQVGKNTLDPGHFPALNETYMNHPSVEVSLVPNLWMNIAIDKKGKCKLVSGNEIDKLILEKASEKGLTTIDGSDLKNTKLLIKRVQEDEARKEKTRQIRERGFQTEDGRSIERDSSTGAL